MQVFGGIVVPEATVVTYVLSGPLKSIRVNTEETGLCYGLIGLCGILEF